MVLLELDWQTLTGLIVAVKGILLAIAAIFYNIYKGKKVKDAVEEQMGNIKKEIDNIEKIKSVEKSKT